MVGAGGGPCSGLCSRLRSPLLFSPLLPPFSPPPRHPAPHSQACSPSSGVGFCSLPLLPPSDVAFPSLRDTCFLPQDQDVEEEKVGPSRLPLSCFGAVWPGHVGTATCFSTGPPAGLCFAPHSLVLLQLHCPAWHAGLLLPVSADGDCAKKGQPGAG